MGAPWGKLRREAGVVQLPPLKSLLRERPSSIGGGRGGGGAASFFPASDTPVSRGGSPILLPPLRARRPRHPLLLKEIAGEEDVKTPTSDQFAPASIIHSPLEGTARPSLRSSRQPGGHLPLSGEDPPKLPLGEAEGRRRRTSQAARSSPPFGLPGISSGGSFAFPDCAARKLGLSDSAQPGAPLCYPPPRLFRREGARRPGCTGASIYRGQ